jgi:hypothetical protein
VDEDAGGGSRVRKRGSGVRHAIRQLAAGSGKAGSRESGVRHAIMQLAAGGKRGQGEAGSGMQSCN